MLWGVSIDDFLVHLYFVGIVDDDVELVEMSVVDKPGRFHVSTILYIYLLINVGHRLTVSPVSDYFHRICNGIFIGIGVSLATSCRYGFTKVTKAVETR